MALAKTITIDGQEVVFKASAAIPRIYRIKFGRDVYKDLNDLASLVDKNTEEVSFMDAFSLELWALNMQGDVAAKKN